MTIAHNNIYCNVPSDKLRRYWRLLATDISWNPNYGNYEWNLYEVYLYTIYNYNSIRASVVADASSMINSSYPPSNTQDDTMGLSLWSAFWPNTTPQWISFDCGYPLYIYSIALMVNSYRGYVIGPKSFDIQYSDDNINWITVKSVNQPYNLPNQSLFTIDNIWE